MTFFMTPSTKHVFYEEQKQKALEDMVIQELSGTPLYEKIAFLKTQKGDEPLLQYPNYETNLSPHHINAIFMHKRNALFSNCYGSLIFCLSAEEKIKSSWRYLKELTLNEIRRERKTITDKLFIRKINKTDRIYVFPSDLTSGAVFIRPGYVGFDFMSDFVRFCVDVEDKKNAVGGFVMISSLARTKGKPPSHLYLFHHCGIYLGEKNGDDIIFHQQGYSGKFCFDTVQNYISNPPARAFKGINEPYYQVKYYRTVN
jgi:hypothetical protein